MLYVLKVRDYLRRNQSQLTRHNRSSIHPSWKENSLKFKKSLITLAAASSVAMAGIPAAVAEEAPEAAATAATENSNETATKPAAEENADENAAEEGAAEDETKPADENDNETKPAEGSADSEQGQKLKGSVDKLLGWDDSTSTLKKIEDVLGFIGKIVKTFTGFPGSK